MDLSDLKSKTLPFWSKKGISRRSVLKGIAAVGATSALMGCSSSDDDDDSSAPIEYFPPIPDIDGKLVKGTAPHNCGGRCLAQAYVVNGVIKRIITDERNDEDGNLALRSCMRCRSYKKRVHHPGRLQYPLMQKGDRGNPATFQKVTWQEAIDYIHTKLTSVISTHGNKAVYNQYASGTAGRLAGAPSTTWLNAMGGVTRMWGSYSSHQINYIAPLVQGGSSALTTDPANLRKSKTILMWGSNFVDSINDTNVSYHFVRAKEAGAKMIFIGPVHNSSAELADEWIPIKPGGDAPVMLAMLHTMIMEDLLDDDEINNFTIGFYDQQTAGNVPAGRSLSAYVMGPNNKLVTAGKNLDVANYTFSYNGVTSATSTYPHKAMMNIEKTPAWASAISGVPEAKIKELARLMAKPENKPVFLHVSLGMQRQAEGVNNMWLCTALIGATGNWGIPGAGWSKYFTYSGVSLNSFTSIANPITDVIPCSSWTDAVINAGNSEWKDGEVNKLTKPFKFIWTEGGNIMNQHMDTYKTAAMMKDKTKVECHVVVEQFMTPTALYADVILPAAMNWEQDDMFGHNNYVVFGNKAVNPPGEAKTHFEMVEMLADKAGKKAEIFGGKSYDEWLKFMYKSADKTMSFEQFKEAGVYVGDKLTHPVGSASVRANGKVNTATATTRFGATKTGYLELYSANAAQADYVTKRGNVNVDSEGDPIVYPIPVHFPVEEHFPGMTSAQMSAYPLHCLSNHNRYRSHSTHDNNPYLRELYKYDKDGKPCNDSDTFNVDPQQANFGTGAGLEPIMINPADAGSITTGDRVKVTSFILQKEGGTYIERSAYASAIVTERIIKGVVNIQQGAWFDPIKDNGADVDQGGSANTLFSERPSRMDHGNAQMTARVKIAKA